MFSGTVKSELSLVRTVVRRAIFTRIVEEIVQLKSYKCRKCLCLRKCLDTN